MTMQLIEGDCLSSMAEMADGSVDLVFASPPYEAARTYGIDCNLKGQAWVDWAVERYLQCVRVSRGLVAWVVEGQTRQFRYSATPSLLMADLHRAGVKLRKPPIYKRVGIPGSGGPDWLRNDWEFVVCPSSGMLPWSDNTAMGHPPKYKPGGAMSNRHADGRRKNRPDNPKVKAERIKSYNGVKDIGRVISKIGDRAGIVVKIRKKRTEAGEWEEVKKCATAHDLRRTFAARWSLQVKPLVLQHLMRHADIKTTLQYYTGDLAEILSGEVWSEECTKYSNEMDKAIDSESCDNRVAQAAKR